MRFALVPWIVLSAAAVASAEPIETLTRDISLSAHARAESLESMSGSITLRPDSRVSGDVRRPAW